MPLFSIIIPTYNRERVIGQTVQSVLNQTDQDFEIIIVDDGSEDDTKSVLVNFHSDKIKYYYQQNQGAQVARNYGLSKATGKYVCFLDSDDLLMPAFLEEMLPEFEDEEVGCVYCTKGYKKESGEVILASKRYLSGWVYKEALSQLYIASPSFMLIRRTCIDDIGEWDVDFPACQDDDYCLRIAQKYKFKYVPKLLALYREVYIGSENRICNSSPKLALGRWLLVRKFRKDILRLCGPKVLTEHYWDCALSFRSNDMKDECGEAIRAAEEVYGSKEDMEWDFIGNLKAFLCDNNFYCYGAGDIGGRIVKFLKELGIECNGFIVSRRTGKDDSYINYPVFSVGEFNDFNSKILVTTSEQLHDEIKNIIKEKKLKNDIFYISDHIVKYITYYNSLSGEFPND